MKLNWTVETLLAGERADFFHSSDAHYGHTIEIALTGRRFILDFIYKGTRHGPDHHNPTGRPV